MLDDAPLTLITGSAPFDLTAARSWAAHGGFQTWAEATHRALETAVYALTNPLPAQSNPHAS